MKTILITGGAGFIGSALVRMLARDTDYRVVNVDKLTYAGNLESLAEALDAPAHCFVNGDICDANLLRSVFEKHAPIGVIHLAAESHVDRSRKTVAWYLEHRAWVERVQAGTYRGERLGLGVMS